MGLIIGVVLGLCIGAACRLIDIPLPAPPKLVGALLVVAMTAGFVATDLLLAPG
jgi:XapX domain-containing protein